MFVSRCCTKSCVTPLSQQWVRYDFLLIYVFHTENCSLSVALPVFFCSCVNRAMFGNNHSWQIHHFNLWAMLRPFDTQTKCVHVCERAHIRYVFPASTPVSVNHEKDNRTEVPPVTRPLTASFWKPSDICGAFLPPSWQPTAPKPPFLNILTTRSRPPELHAPW